MAVKWTPFPMGSASRLPSGHIYYGSNQSLWQKSNILNLANTTPDSVFFADQGSFFEIKWCPDTLTLSPDNPISLPTFPPLITKPKMPICVSLTKFKILRFPNKISKQLPFKRSLSKIQLGYAGSLRTE